MATIDIGKLTFTHKGDYASGTAYVANDVVYYSTNGNAYIAKQSTQGNAPTNATYWNLFVLKGTDGVDADLGSISGTVQGDIYYNNGSTIARLAPGTSGQVLQTGGASANPSWTTMSSDVVKISSGSFSGNAYVNLDGTSVWGAANTYAAHKVLFRVKPNTNGAQLYSRLLQSGVEVTSTIYIYATKYNGSNGTNSTIVQSEGAGEFRWTRDGQTNGSFNFWEFDIFHMNYNSSIDGSDNVLRVHTHAALNNQDGANRLHGTEAYGMINRGSMPSGTTGMNFYVSSGTIEGDYYVYGFKK